jgi:hypothetical protein
MNLFLLSENATDVNSDLQFVKHFDGLIGGAEAAIDNSVGGLVEDAIMALENNQFQKSQLIGVPSSSKIGSRFLLVLSLGKINKFSLNSLQNAISYAVREAVMHGFKSVATPVIGINAGLPVDQAYRTIISALISSLLSHISETGSPPCINDFIIFDYDRVKVSRFIKLTPTILSELNADYRQISPFAYDINLDSILNATKQISSERNQTTISYRAYEDFLGNKIITPNLIKVLFLASNPRDTQPLRLDEEIREIDTAFRQSDYRNRFDIRQQWAVRVIDLQTHLLRHRPDILHFSGHGSSTNSIILENNQGLSQPVSTNALGKLFMVLRDNIKCVVLNACYSEDQALAIADNIDCVIGMSKAIGDTAAIMFATAFYSALGYGRDVKTAFDLGCIQIDLDNLKEEDTPKLIAKRVDPQKIYFVSDK